MPKTDEQVLIAKNDTKRLGIPWIAYEAYRIQYHNAKRRDLLFLFDLQDWWAWWQEESELGGPRWTWRGLKGDGLVMCRQGDQGPYSRENVYCARTSKNIRDTDWTSASEKHLARWAAKTPEERAQHHLAVRGDGHPKSKAVITPKGRFGSIALAGEAYGKTRQWAAHKVRDGAPGWSYEAKAPTSDADFNLAAD